MSASDFKDPKLAEALAECERLREENRQLRGRLELPVPEVAVPPTAAPAPAGTVTTKSNPEEKVKFFLSPTFGTRAFGESRSLKRLGKAELTLARSSLQNLHVDLNLIPHGHQLGWGLSSELLLHPSHQ